MRPSRKNAKASLKAPPKKRAREVERIEDLVAVEGVIPIGQIQWRHKARIAGRVTSVEVQPWRGPQVLSCTLVDRTGSVTLVFTRRNVPGIETGLRSSRRYRRGARGPPRPLPTRSTKYSGLSCIPSATEPQRGLSGP